MRIYFDKESLDYVDDDFIVHTAQAQATSAREFELNTAFMLVAEYRKLSYNDKNIKYYELSDDQQELRFYSAPVHEGKHVLRLPEDMTIQELSNYCDKHDLRIAYDGTLQPVSEGAWVSDAFMMPVADLEDMLAYIKQHAKTQKDGVVLSKLRAALF